MKISVRVHPRSRQSKVVRTEQGLYKVYVSQAPEDGKANEAVRELLAGHFRKKKRQIVIERGETSRDKIIHIMENH